VLEVLGTEGSHTEIVVWNPDGSTAELSGNGTRIAAGWLLESTDADEVVVAVGNRRVRARRAPAGRIEQDLGAIDVRPDETLDVDGEPVTVTPVSVGNPHAVVRHAPTRSELLRLGPRLERHPRFPDRTNVQLVEPDSSRTLTVAIWERGAGETPASGTSAAAAAAAAIAHGWCTSPVTVRMPGGDLDVALVDGHAVLTGPVEQICRGEVAAAVLAVLDEHR
jgi:diaminopimelate epimerase